MEVRFTAPYRAWPLFEANEPPAAARPAVRAGAKVGRNDPCPCGSGRKYKKCCMGKEKAAGPAVEASPEPEGLAPSPLHEMDRRLAARLLMYAGQRFGDLWANLFEELSGGNQDDQITGQLLAYHFDWEGKTLCRWFMEERGSSLSPREREWLLAQQESWLSVLEVQAVEPGRSVTLRDLLTGRESTVREVGASQTLVRRDALLGRIVDLRGEALLCGSHHRPLPPVEAAEVVERARKRLRLKRNVPAERLRGEKICMYLLDLWEDELEEIDDRFSRPPRMQNTDGDELLLTTDLFEFDPADREDPNKEPPPLEAVEALLEYKRRHYDDWADHPLPALSGRTPREAVGTREGRQRVDALLKHMENLEARSPLGQAFDFSSLRSSLGL